MIEFLTHMIFWHWFFIGAVLLILELLTGGGFLFWTGLSAIVVGVLTFLIPDLVWPVQWMSFSLLALLAAFGWWTYLKKRPTQTDQPVLNRRAEQYIGRVVTLDEPVINGIGKVRLDDSTWRVRCIDLPKGSRVRITGIDGVILIAEEIER